MLLLSSAISDDNIICKGCCYTLLSYSSSPSHDWNAWPRLRAETTLRYSGLSEAGSWRWSQPQSVLAVSCSEPGQGSGLSTVDSNGQHTFPERLGCQANQADARPRCKNLRCNLSTTSSVRRHPMIPALSNFRARSQTARNPRLLFCAGKGTAHRNWKAQAGHILPQGPLRTSSAEAAV